MPSKKIPRSPEQDAARKAQKKLQWQRWYERNAEQTRAKSRAWKAANTERQRAKKAQYREAHQAEIRAYRRAYYLARQQEELAYARAYRQNPANQPAIHQRNKVWRARNAAYMRALCAAWLRAHASRRRVYTARRRARKAAAPINDFTHEQWEVLCKRVKYRCCYCGAKGTAETLTPDHLTPYVKQGSNTLHNVLPCCSSCNSRKKDRAVLKPVQPFLLLPEDLAE
jgi:5-methylcytosine-specific restriction endonuclease McrA